MREHCCEMMTDNVNYRCPVHPDPYDCPDNLIVYHPRFDEYGIIVHDGGSSSILFQFCPWCGARLPESRRDRWFEELERLGFDDPGSQPIPDAYTSDEWYRPASG